MGAVLSPCAGCIGSQRREFTRSSLKSSVWKGQPSVLSPEEHGLLMTLEAVHIPSPQEQLLNSIDEKAELFCEIVNTAASADLALELVVERDGCSVYSKTTSDGFVIRSEWTAAFPPKTYLDFLCDIQQRKAWDKHLSHVELIEKLSPNVTVYYQAYHKVLAVAGRDLVLACKKFQKTEAWVDVFCSVDLPICPPKDKLVRASVTLGGYRVAPLGEGCQVIAYTEGSLGGALPQALVKRFTAVNVPGFVQTVAKNLQAYLNAQISADNSQ